MTPLQAWIATPAAHALGWTLVHSLWQGALAAALVGLVLLVTRSPRIRYAAGFLAFGAMLAGFISNFWRFLNEFAPLPVHAPITGGMLRALPLPPVMDPPSAAAAFLPWLAPFWIVGVVVFHLRSLAGWISVSRITRRGVCAAPDEWQRKIASFQARLRITRPVRLLESCFTQVPVVVGQMRPVILLPLGLLAGLPAAQVEAILLHELAHIRRYDYVLNLLQASVEAIFFYHPAVWWISHVIRAEREHCCDDLVVAANGDAYVYAVALTALEQNRAAAVQTALAATGGTLVKRIRRLLEPSEGPRITLAPAISAAILAVAAAVSMAAWQARTTNLPVPPAPVSASAGSPFRKWLNEDVAYIALPEERAAFLALQTNEEREHFIEQFWLRRNPSPGSGQNPFKQEHYRRIAYANEHFASATMPGWKTDRGRTYIVYGPPDEIESHPAGGKYVSPDGGTAFTYPFEQWRYRLIANIGENIIVEFVDPDFTGDFHMTTDPAEKKARGPVDGLAAHVEITPDNVIRVSFPNPGSGDRATILGRISRQGRVVQTFHDSLPDTPPMWTKSISLPAGTYHLDLVVTDVTHPAMAHKSAEFEMK